MFVLTHHWGVFHQITNQNLENWIIDHRRTCSMILLWWKLLGTLKVKWFWWRYQVRTNQRAECPRMTNHSREKWKSFVTSGEGKMNHQHEDKLCFKVYVLVLVTYQHGMGPLSIHSFSFEKMYCEIRIITSKICSRQNEAFRKSYKYLV